MPNKTLDFKHINYFQIGTKQEEKVINMEQLSNNEQLDVDDQEDLEVECQKLKEIAGEH